MCQNEIVIVNCDNNIRVQYCADIIQCELILVLGNKKTVTLILDRVTAIVE